MSRWRRWRGFLLVWLGSSLVVVSYVLLVAALNGTPNWVDVLVLSGWVALASRWLDASAGWLRRSCVATWAAGGFLLVMLQMVALPWSLRLPVDNGFWQVTVNGQYFLEFSDLTLRRLTLTIPETLYIVNHIAVPIAGRCLARAANVRDHFQMAGTVLASGFGLSALSLSWCVTWGGLLRTPAVVVLWEKFRHLITWLCRTCAWDWLRRGLAWALVLVIALDTLGILLTIRPVAVRWEPVTTAGFPSRPSLSVQTLAVGPDGETLFAGTWGGGVFRSDDGGRSWQAASLGLTSFTVETLAVGPDGVSLFAGTYHDGIFRSDDGGRSWQAASQGLADLYVQALAVGPDGESLFAGTWGGRVFRSDDGGRSWRAASQGLISHRVRALAVGPGEESLFAGTVGGVFRSDDWGLSWQEASQGLTSLDVRALAVGPDGESLFAGTVGSGVFRSDDGGRNWQAASRGMTFRYVRALVVGPDGDSLFAGTFSGVFRSDDGGRSWQVANQGLNSLSVQTLAVRPDGESLFAGVVGGVFHSDDGGRSWQEASQGPANLEVRALAAGPGEETLFAGTWGGVFRSDDRGRSWQVANQGLDSLSVQALAAGPDGESLFAGVVGGVFRSDDGGRSWQEASQGLANLDVRALAVGPDGETLFAGTHGGLFRSDDGGQSWHVANQGLNSLSVQTLAVGPDREILFAGIWGDVFRSDDGGRSWQQDRGLLTSDLSSATFENMRMAAKDNEVSLTRPRMGWLRWATHRYQAPEAFAIHSHTATLYASAGAAMILRAEVPLPLIWRAPTSYLALVASTWSVFYWVGANAVALLVGSGLLLAVVSLYVYFGIARPNRLRPSTLLWLLPRPRHLLSASAYQRYVQRWGSGDDMERLVLLQAPTNESFASSQLEEALRHLGAAFDVQGLRATLVALVQRGLLVQDDGTWRLAEPLLAQVQRHEIPPDEPARLAERIRRQHPLYTRTRDFFAQARFHMKELSPEEILLIPQRQDQPQIAYGLMYAHLIAGRPPTGDDFSAVCEAARDQYGDDLSHHVAMVISDRRPEPGARYRLYEIRQREGLAIVPLDTSLFGQIRPNRTANDILAAEIDQATGLQNLFAISGPVSGDLSFFGREPVLQEIIDLLNAGQPVGVFGLRKAGKTSLVQRIQGRLAQKRLIALVDTQGTARQQGVWPLYPAIIAAFAAHLKRYRPEAALPDLRLWPKVSNVSPAWAEAFVQDLQALHTAIGQPGSGERLLLVVDEVDRLLPARGSSGYEGFATFLGQLRAANQQGQMLDFLVVGVDPMINRRERWRDRDNELYRALREVWMPPMAPEDVREMIESLGSQMGIRYENEALDLLARCGGGQPFVTRQMCSRAVEGRPDRGAITVTLDQARMAIEEFIFHDSYLTEMWRTRLDDTQREILCALAQSSGPLPRTKLLPAIQRQKALGALSVLEDYTLVCHEGDGYIAAWDVLRKWIRWVELGQEY